MIILEEKELIRVSRFVGRLARNVLFEFVGLAMAERTGDYTDRLARIIRFRIA